MVLFLQIVAAFILFLLGFLLGRTNLHHKIINDLTGNGDYIGKPNKSRNWATKVNQKLIATEIDESKFVVDDDISTFKKSYQTLGNKIKSKDKIENSVSKLSALKGKK